MKNGYIKLFRAIEEWEWIDDHTMLFFWVRILLMANWEDRNWHGETIERGSFVTTLSSLSKELGLSVKQVRTCLARLQKGKEITIEGTSVRTKVTICKYDYYQGCEANEGQTNGTPEGKRRANNNKEEYNTSDTNVSSYSIQEDKKEKKEEDTAVSSKKDSVDFDSVLSVWNSFATRSVPKIRSLSPARKEKVKLRVKEMGGWEKAKDILAECFKKISESDFCNGATGRWAASFDWFFENEKNWLKVLEGNYDNRKEKSQLEVLTENIKKAHEYYGQQYGYGGASAYGNQAGGREDGPDEQ